MRCATALVATALSLPVQLAACASEAGTNTSRSSLPMPAASPAQAPTGTAGSSAGHLVTPGMMAAPSGTMPIAPTSPSPIPPTPSSTPSTPGPSSAPPANAEPKPNSATPPMAAASPRPDLDRNATFDWPETAPGDGSLCQPGTYVGTFTCVYADLGITLEGPVTLQFEKSMDGEFLDLADAKLDGVGGVFGFSAQLAGRLDCTTLQFSAEVTTGVYGVGFPDLPPSGTFTGTLQGALDRDTAQLEGEWALLSDLAAISSSGDCVGPWTAGLKP